MTAGLATLQCLHPGWGMTSETASCAVTTFNYLLIHCCTGNYSSACCLLAAGGWHTRKHTLNIVSTFSPPLCLLQVLQESELRLMTIAQLINGTRESALLRVARCAKQFAKVLPAVCILHFLQNPQTFDLAHRLAGQNTAFTAAWFSKLHM